MSPTRRYENDRWLRDEGDRYDSVDYRGERDGDEPARGRYRYSAERYRGRGAYGDEGNYYRQSPADAAGQNLRPGSMSWPEDRGYDDYREFQQNRERARERYEYQPQRGGYYSQQNEPYRYPEPLPYGRTRGTGPTQDDWRQGRREEYQGAATGRHAGYDEARSHSWRENYGNTERQYEPSSASYMGIPGSYGSSGYRDSYGSYANWEAANAGFRGQGPKDYKRSDTRIQEDVNDCLTDSAYLDASAINVAVKDGEVTLAGTVNSRACKREAEDLADRISGVKHVQNNLRIQKEAAGGYAAPSGSNTASFAAPGSGAPAPAGGKSTGRTTS